MSTGNIASNMRKTTEALLYSWNGDWINSAEPNLATRAPECQHVMMPSSVGGPAQSNDQWAEYFEHVAPLVTDCKMIIHDYLGVPEERRAVCRSSTDASTPAGPFHNEYVWILTFNETGDKITRIEEFLDSKATAEIRAKIAEGAKQQAA